MSDATRARDRRHGLTRRVVQAVVTIVLLLLLWRVADGQDAVGLLLDANPWWLVLAGILLLLHTVFAALRWRAAAAPLGIDLSRRRATAEYFLALLGNTTLPGGVLGDAARATRSRHHAGLARAAGAVVIERSIGQIALVIVLGATFVVTLFVPTGVDWPPSLAAAIAAVLAAVVIGSVLLALAVRRARDPGSTRWARALHAIRIAVASPGAAGAQTAYSAGTAVTILAAFACCAAAVGAPLSIAAVCSVVPLVLLSMLLPISIGGWGVREGAAVALLPIAGLSSTQALATSVAFGAVALIAAAPGVAAVWSARRAAAPDLTPTAAGDDADRHRAVEDGRQADACRTRIPVAKESS